MDEQQLERRHVDDLMTDLAQFSHIDISPQQKGAAGQATPSILSADAGRAFYQSPLG